MKWYILMSAALLAFSSRSSLPFTVSSTNHSHVLNVLTLVESINKNVYVNQHHHSVSHPSWRKLQPMWYILMPATSLGFSSNLFLPSTVSSTTNTYDLNIVRLVERITIFQVNQHYYSVSHPSWRKFQPKWYILMSTTSLNFSSNLFMLSTVSSTNN